MKNRNIDCLHDMVGTLCRQIDDPSGLTHLYEVMVAVIELARTDRSWRAVSVAGEVVHYMARMAEERGQELGARMLAEERAPSASTRTTQPSFTGFVQLTPDAPRPAATVEQMRAAADAAMASDEEMDEYECDSCHKTTLVPMDSGTPKGWQPSDNPDGEEYICNECHTFGRPGKP